MKQTIEGGKDFLMAQFLNLTFNGAFQHAGVYRDNSITDEKKRDFRTYLSQELSNFVDNFKNNHKDWEHTEKIQKFCDDISRSEWKKILKKEVFRFGVGQKLINLYMKYMWCLGELGELTPPHCPFDGIIIGNLGSDKKWTKFNSKDEYNELIELAKDKRFNPNGKCLSEWEMEIFNQKQNYN